ncbi:hypothetical protein EVAR_101784_1 [Eumeta japonica]|uniref:Uncharacterized protein n=1 Tax=Eumeta variegata TaxID=151549 RepID=A0A4C1SQS2_EUMVA|nr:hypothetical protein EVAR_101784_1 [Eumeta japonica]
MFITNVSQSAIINAAIRLAPVNTPRRLMPGACAARCGRVAATSAGRGPRARRCEKDLTEPKNAILAKQVADCLSVAFDSVLCLCKLHEKAKPKPRDPKSRRELRLEKMKITKSEIDEDVTVLTNLRQRAHALIR